MQLINGKNLQYFSGNKSQIDKKLENNERNIALGKCDVWQA